MVLRDEEPPDADASRDCAAIAVSPLLEFSWGPLEQAWRAHASAVVYPHLDLAIVLVNSVMNWVVYARVTGTGEAPGSALRGFQLMGIDTLFMVVHVALIVRRRSLYARNRLLLLTMLRGLRAAISSKGFPKPCPLSGLLRIFLSSPSSSNLLLALSVLPLRLHLLLQAFAAVRAGAGAAAACTCARAAGAAPTLLLWRGRLSALHAAVAFPLLPAPNPGAAAEDGHCSPATCCVPVLASFAAMKAFAATTVISVFIDAGTRAAWVSSGAPGAPLAARRALASPTAVRAARRVIVAAALLVVAVIAASAPLTWGAAATLAAWSSRPTAPPAAEVLAYGTAAIIQVFMRIWAGTVLRELVTRPLLALLARRDVARAHAADSPSGDAATAAAAAAAAGAAGAALRSSSPADVQQAATAPRQPLVGGLRLRTR